jgi:glutamate synthase (NADPH/NADH) small chain
MANKRKIQKSKSNNLIRKIYPPLSIDEALMEGIRCLYCYDAPCIQACPTKIDVPTFIKRILEDNMKGASRIIFKANCLAGSCARACPVEVLCEGACVLNELNQRPVAIGRLQRFVTDWAMKNKLFFYIKGKPNGKKVAIVGAGPAGLACAVELIQMGYEVKTFESRDLPGGLNAFAVNPTKVDLKFALQEVAMLKKLGMKIQSNTTIGVDIPFENLLKKYDAIFLGIGLGKSALLKIPGENLKGIYDALDFIEIVKTSPCKLNIKGKKVAILGGGNSALNSAIQAKILGAEYVYIFYRRSKEEMPGYPSEFDQAKLNECMFFWQMAPLAILGRNKVEKVKLIKTKLGTPDSSGRRKPIPIKGSEEIFKADVVIKALGQQMNDEFLSKIKGLKIKNGLVQINKKTYQTSILKVFAGGDCVSGGKEIVNAVAEAKKAALAIHSFLSD